MGKPTLAWDGWFQQWLADGNTRETELHCLYGQPEFTVPAGLFCTRFGQQQETVLWCSLSGLAVLWQMGSSGCAGRMDSSARALPVVHQLLRHPALKEWRMLQEVNCIGSWPVSFGTALTLSDYIVSDYNGIWFELQTISVEPCLIGGSVNPVW